MRHTCGSFIFPGTQFYPHCNFSEEVVVLDSNFGKIGSSRKAYAMDISEKQQKCFDDYLVKINSSESTYESTDSVESE